jgi:transcriptional regulator with XRE-family HTH domain
LRKAREKAGMSCLALDKAAGLSPGHVGKIESGERQNPGIRTVSVLAFALKVSIAWLAMGAGKP